MSFEEDAATPCFGMMAAEDELDSAMMASDLFFANPLPVLPPFLGSDEANGFSPTATGLWGTGLKSSLKLGDVNLNKSSDPVAAAAAASGSEQDLPRMLDGVVPERSSRQQHQPKQQSQRLQGQQQQQVRETHLTPNSPSGSSGSVPTVPSLSTSASLENDPGREMLLRRAAAVRAQRQQLLQKATAAVPGTAGKPELATSLAAVVPGATFPAAKVSSPLPFISAVDEGIHLEELSFRTNLNQDPKNIFTDGRAGRPEGDHSEEGRHQPELEDDQQSSSGCRRNNSNSSAGGGSGSHGPSFSDMERKWLLQQQQQQQQQVLQEVPASVFQPQLFTPPPFPYAHHQPQQFPYAFPHPHQQAFPYGYGGGVHMNMGMGMNMSMVLDPSLAMAPPGAVPLMPPTTATVADGVPLYNPPIQPSYVLPYSRQQQHQQQQALATSGHLLPEFAASDMGVPEIPPPTAAVSHPLLQQQRQAQALRRQQMLLQQREQHLKQLQQQHKQQQLKQQQHAPKEFGEEEQKLELDAPVEEKAGEAEVPVVPVNVGTVVQVDASARTHTTLPAVSTTLPPPMQGAAGAPAAARLSAGALARQQRACVDALRGKRRRPMAGTGEGGLLEPATLLVGEPQASVANVTPAPALLTQQAGVAPHPSPSSPTTCARTAGRLGAKSCSVAGGNVAATARVGDAATRSAVTTMAALSPEGTLAAAQVSAAESPAVQLRMADPATPCAPGTAMAAGAQTVAAAPPAATGVASTAATAAAAKATTASPAPAAAKKAVTSKAVAKVKEERRRKRLLRNRVSAQQARERRRSYIQDLEHKCAELTQTNEMIEERIRQLTNENEMLRRVMRRKVKESVKEEALHNDTFDDGSP